MSAHPMLQPTDWAATPQSLAQGIPEQRRQLYELVWNSALACTLKAPLLRHSRFNFKAHQTNFAVACVQADTSRTGYWHFATDYPQWWFPTEPRLPPGDKLVLKKTWVEKANTLTMGQLLRTMSRLGIGTPASTARLLEESFGLGGIKQPAMLELRVSQPGQPMCVSLTTFATTKLASWQSQHLIGKTAVTNAAVKAVEEGAIGYRKALTLLARMDRGDAADAARHLQAEPRVSGHVLDRICMPDQAGVFDEARSSFSATRLYASLGASQLLAPDGPSIFQSLDNEDAATKAALFIDAICGQWAGVSREESYQAVACNRTTLPQHPGLPEWLDPEVQLPADHPLRVLRQQMEDDLVVKNGYWQTLDNDQRATLRASWLQDHQDRYADLNAVFKGPGAQFSALRYWLTGQR